MKNMLIMTLLLLLLTACNITGSPSAIKANIPQSEPLATLQIPTCDLKPIKIPILPSFVPGPTQLDEATGLHMTGLVQEVDFPSYRLRITGSVAQPLNLQYDEIRCLPKVTAAPSLICPGFFVDEANWSGTPLSEILKLAQPLPQAKSVYLISADGFKTKIDLEDALNPENFLAYELEGKPLPVLHGFPLRAIFPAKDGNSWVKWLVEINVQ